MMIRLFQHSLEEEMVIIRIQEIVFFFCLMGKIIFFKKFFLKKGDSISTYNDYNKARLNFSFFK